MWHCIMFPCTYVNPGRHFITFSCMQWSLQGTAPCFLPCFIMFPVKKPYCRGHCITYSPLHNVFSHVRIPYRALQLIFSTGRAPQRALHHICLHIGEPRGHCIMHSSLEGHPRAHMFSHIYSRCNLQGIASCLLAYMGSLEGMSSHSCM